MASSVKIPIPQSAFIIDPQTGRPTREWYIFLENLSSISGGLAALPNARIWIGDASSNPVAHTVTGDISLSNVGLAQLQVTANTAEIAQDAVGSILTDTATVNLTYSDSTPSITADVIRQMSVTADASGIKLVNDEASPGNDMVYGTDGAGVKGWQIGGGSGGGYWSPLTNGDPASPAIVFDATTGDTIAIWTAT